MSQCDIGSVPKSWRRTRDFVMLLIDRQAFRFEVFEYTFLSTLTEDEFLYANTHFTHGWRLQTSRFRIAGSKIGRNIEGRYKTGLKQEPKIDKTGQKSSPEESERRYIIRLKTNVRKVVASEASPS